MVTVILVLIAVLVVLKILSSVRDRQMSDSGGVSLSRETRVDHLPRAPQHHHPWSSTSGTLWSDGSGGDYFDSGDSEGGGDSGGGDSGGGGDFGGGDSG